MALLSVTTFLVLLIGLVISIKTLFSPERPAVAAVILAETLAVAVISALSAWLFRCWLRDIEAYEAEK